MTVPPLPNNAANTAAGPAANIYSVSCASVGSCVAVGNYEVTPNVDNQPLIETLTNGSWTALQAPLPSNADTSDQTARLTDVSCASDGTCAAIGSYTAPGSVLPSPFIETFLNGTWTASVPPVPSGDSDVNGLDDASCASDTTCVITVGDFYETLNSGQWSALGFPVPNGTQNVNVGPLSCLPSGFCLATGSYYGTTEDQTGPLFEMYSDGTWTASLAPVPSDAMVPYTNLLIGEPICVSADSCVAIGIYETTSDQWAIFSELYSSGSWTLVGIPLPSNAVTSAGLGVKGLSCASGPTCTVIGTYNTASSADPFAFSSTLSGGSWTLGELTWPVASSDLTSTTLSGISCPSTLLCFAVGSYGTTSGGDPTISTEFKLSLP